MNHPSSHAVDVAVIGGGITGCATAWYLANDGVAVALIEAAELNAQASGSNAGSLHGQIPHDTFLELGNAWAASFEPTLRLLNHSIDLWREADQQFAGALDVSVSGGLMLASCEKEMRSIEHKAKFERAANIKTIMLDRKELERIAPYLSPEIIGAGFCEAEGKANPLVAAPTFARGAQAAGAEVIRNQPVVAIERSADRYIVRTTNSIFEARRIVIAAGAATPNIMNLLGAGKLDIQSVPIQVSVTEPVDPMIKQLLYYARAPLTMKQTAAGTIIIGGGWPAKLDAQQRPVPDPVSLGQNLGLALEVVPSLAKLALVRTWAATVNGTDNWTPIIGELPAFPGAFISYVPWMGFSGGPAAARMVANQVQGRSNELDVAESAFMPH